MGLSQTGQNNISIFILSCAIVGKYNKLINIMSYKGINKDRKTVQNFIWASLGIYLCPGKHEWSIINYIIHAEYMSIISLRL